jgi:hypothetical protein
MELTRILSNVLTKSGIPLSQEVATLKIIDYIESILIRTVPKLWKFVKNFIVNFIKHYFYNIYNYFKKKQIEVSLKQYTREIVGLAAQKHLKLQSNLYKFNESLELVRHTKPFYKQSPVSHKYFDGTELTIYGDCVVTTGFSENLIKHHTIRFLKTLQEIANVPRLYVNVKFSEFTLKKNIDASNLIPLTHWQNKVDYIKTNYNSHHGAIAFICNGSPGCGKTSFVLFVAQTIGLSVYVVSNVSMINEIPGKAIVLFDDFDKLGMQDVQKLLSIFDGADSNRNHIYILNVNNIDGLEEKYPTLLRSGRSVIFNFPLPTFGELCEFRDKYNIGTDIREGDTFAGLFQRHIDQKMRLPTFHV